MQKFSKLNFVKTGLKCKFGVNPYFFSHELCLYILNEIPDSHAQSLGSMVRASLIKYS